MFPTCNISPYEANEADAGSVGKLGALHTYDGALWMAVYNNSADTAGVAGQLACQDDSGTVGYVTMKAAEVTTGTLSTTSKPAGMFGTALGVGKYGYVMVLGHTVDADGAAMLVTDGSVAQSDFLVCDGGDTETFIADTAVDGEEEAVFGRALAADTAGSKVIAIINCL